MVDSLSGAAAPPAEEASQRVAELMATFADPRADVAGLLCDRHPAQAPAFVFVAADGAVTRWSFGELAAISHRFANALTAEGVGRGDRVASLMGKGPELVGLMLGIWRLGAVYVPLFTAFAPQAAALRLLGSGAGLVVCDPAQRHKLDAGPDIPADAPWRVVVAGDGSEARPEDLRLADLLEQASADPVGPVAVGGDGPLVHMFTSGTTGKPKGVVHPVAYVAGWQAYLEHALGVPHGASYWCAADPGWAYGLYASIVAPMAAGTSSLLLSGGFSVESTWSTLVEHQVSDFTAAPTVYRGLRTATQPVPAGLVLQRASSAGEPLTPDINLWAREQLGLEVHDHFGQTEVGMPLANHHAPGLQHPIKTGSMGRASPGWAVTILATDRDEPAPVGDVGRVAIDVAASPLMTFTAYQDPSQSSGKFTGGGRFYLLGDAGRLDADGDLFFSSRDDDVIIMAGYRIGPFEIESVLVTHAAVAECAVVAAPDEVRGEVVEAHVVLREGIEASPELAAELQQLVKTRYAAYAYPRTVHFRASLPKTPSGKVQRFVLRQERAGATS